MKKIVRTGVLLLFLSHFTVIGKAQELYIQTEPASNMPAKSLGIRLSNKYFPKSSQDQFRISPELMYGISSKLMIHVKQSFNFTTENEYKPGMLNFYAKYRFLSIDEIQKHTRIAAFASIGYSNSQELAGVHDLMESNTGYSSGIIITQLWHKLALSSTLVVFKRLANKNYDQIGDLGMIYNYSLSAGYLLLPLKYKNYRQANLNLYVELLGTRNELKNYEETHVHKSEDITQKFRRDQVMLAPGLQTILGSRTRIEAGYLFPLVNSKYSQGENMVMLRFEHLLFLH